MATLAKYKYLGLSSVVEVDYPQPQVKLALWATGSPPTYPGLDRFGRVVDHRWIDYGASPDEDVARIQHGYDRNSNRLWRQNDVARALSKKFDQQYTYDGLNRLSDAKTGLLNGSHVIPDADRTFEQQWTLDKLGNWSQFKQDDDGGGTFDLQQTRTANQVNEITAIGASAGPVWATPAYDPAGNTTSFPKPADPTESFTAVYDAWNRMVRVSQVAQSSSSSSSSSGSSSGTTDIQTVQENGYDGRNFRVMKKSYDAGILDETRHAYFTSGWQDIEERVDSSTTAERQFVWGVRYIDDLVVRDRASEPWDGILDERCYAVQDPNWNVAAIVDDETVVQKRFEYKAYGIDCVYDAVWELTDDDREWTCRFQTFAVDIGTRLYNVKHREYATALGRWLSRDLLSYLGGPSLYQFLRSRPIDHLDPMGLIDICPNPYEGSIDLVSGDPNAPAAKVISNDNDFFGLYVKKDWWSSSAVKATKLNDPARSWDLKGESPPFRVYIYDGCIETRFNSLRGEGTEALEARITFFNVLARIHEERVIAELKRIWSPEVVLCDVDGKDVDERLLINEFRKRRDDFDKWKLDKKGPFQSDHSNLVAALKEILKSIGLKATVGWDKNPN